MDLCTTAEVLATSLWRSCERCVSLVELKHRGDPGVWEVTVIVGVSCTVLPLYQGPVLPPLSVSLCLVISKDARAETSLS